MSLSLDQVRQIARLARLKLSPEQEELYAKQLSDILAYMDKLNELDTSQVEPMYSPCPKTNAWREDKVQATSPERKTLDNAPETDGKFFIVPKII